MRKTAAAIAVACLLGAVGCSSDDKGSTPSSPTAPPGVPALPSGLPTNLPTRSVTP